MPLFEYFCEKCDKVHTMLMKIDESQKEIICPDCGGKAIKILSAPYFKIHGFSAQNGYSKKKE